MGGINTANERRAQAIACGLRSFERSATVQGGLKSRILEIIVSAEFERDLGHLAPQAGTASVLTVAFGRGSRSADAISLSYSVYPRRCRRSVISS